MKFCQHTLQEIQLTLSKASNTSPAQDKIEYLHMRRADKNDKLLHVIFDAVNRIGILS